MKVAVAFFPEAGLGRRDTPFGLLLLLLVAVPCLFATLLGSCWWPLCVADPFACSCMQDAQRHEKCMNN